MHEALNMVYSLSDNGIIDFKDKDYAISFILQKVTERVHYINVTLKKELHSELMMYDRDDDTSHVFTKYKNLKEKLILEICDFDEEEFKRFLAVKKL